MVLEVPEGPKNFATGMKSYMARWNNEEALKQERNVCGDSQRRSTR